MKTLENKTCHLTHYASPSSCRTRAPSYVQYLTQQKLMYKMTFQWDTTNRLIHNYYKQITIFFQIEGKFANFPNPTKSEQATHRNARLDALRLHNYTKQARNSGTIKLTKQLLKQKQSKTPTPEENTRS